jgi:hypothetical protein
MSNLTRLTSIKAKELIGTFLECDGYGTGDGKYGSRIQDWIVYEVLELNGYNDGEGPDIPGDGKFCDIEIKSQRLGTASAITLTSLVESDWRGFSSWSEQKKRKVNSDFIFVNYIIVGGDLIQITNIYVIQRHEFADVFENLINTALSRPNKRIQGDIIAESGNNPRIRITQNRLKKDILRKSNITRKSTIDTLFEMC